MLCYTVPCSLQIVSLKTLLSSCAVNTEQQSANYHKERKGNDLARRVFPVALTPTFADTINRGCLSCGSSQMKTLFTESLSTNVALSKKVNNNISIHQKQ